MGIFDSIVGKKNNVERGKEAEDLVKFQLEIQGKEVIRSGKGSDWIAVDKDIFGRIIKKTPVEVKRNKSQLSKLQKKTKGLKVVRVKDDWLGNPTNISRN